MKYLSFKILLLCILLPPFCYIFSIQAIEKHLQSRYQKEINEIYIGDTQPLFDGSIQLKEAINRNIDAYLKRISLIGWGLNLKISVTTRHGKILYPAIFDDNPNPSFQIQPMSIAAENYQTMNEGLLVNLDLKLAHNSLLSNLILSFYICLSALTMYLYYHIGARKARQADIQKNEEIKRLQAIEENYSDSIRSLAEDRKKLKNEIDTIKTTLESAKLAASRNEDDMINEIVGLEEKLNKNLELQAAREAEIEDLKEKIEILEGKRRKAGKAKKRGTDSLQKRFKTLYKNISVHERAIEGFIDLPEDMKIKAEEMIHRLNDAPAQVPIKRKVFAGKKHRSPVQEIIFAYKGRLYFQTARDDRIEVLTIGTKNTQQKDLEFIEKM